MSPRIQNMGSGAPAYNRGGKRVNPAVRGGGSSAPSFFPLTLPDPLHITDAIESPWTDAGSNRISQVNDLSGNNNHLVQATSANQPLYLATGLNNHPTWQISNSPRRFDLTTLIGQGARSIYITLQLDISSRFQYILRNPSQAYFGAITNFTKFAGASDTGGYHEWGSNGAISTGTPFVITITCTNVSGANSFKFYINGTQRSVVTNNGNLLNFRIANLGPGTGDIAGEWIDGRVSNLYVYGSVHTTPDQQAMESFLNTRFVA